MKIKDVILTLERFAPLPLQESYDNAGLQVGLTDVKTSRVLLCLDVTEEVIAKAVELGCNLIVAHHPLLFRGVKCIAERNIVERCVRLAIKNDITLYAAHTNLDNVAGGVNDKMAEKLGLTETEFLQSNGVVAGKESGSGLIGKLPNPSSPQDFLQLVKTTFGCESIQYAKSHKETIQRVAICGGAGEFLLQTAAQKEADAFITGEIGYHHFFGWERNLWIVAAGHFETERYTVELLQEILQKEHPEVKFISYKESTSPIHYF